MIQKSTSNAFQLGVFIPYRYMSSVALSKACCTLVQIRPEPTRHITAEPKQNSLKDIFSDSSDGSEKNQCIITYLRVKNSRSSAEMK